MSTYHFHYHHGSLSGQPSFLTWTTTISSYLVSLLPFLLPVSVKNIVYFLKCRRHHGSSLVKIFQCLSFSPKMDLTSSPSFASSGSCDWHLLLCLSYFVVPILILLILSLDYVKIILLPGASHDFLSAGTLLAWLASSFYPGVCLCCHPFTKASNHLTKKSYPSPIPSPISLSLFPSLQFIYPLYTSYSKIIYLCICSYPAKLLLDV
jgi:hypothetical protein